MKVWEYIKRNFNDTKDIDRDALRSEMYMQRMTPCDAEEEFNVLKNDVDKFNELCDGECDKCLDKYLDMEV